MTHADLVTMLDFHYWARDRVLDAASLLTPEQFTRDLHSRFPSVRDTLVHLLFSSEWAWYQRWQGTSPTQLLDPSAYSAVPTLRGEWNTHEAKMRAPTRQ